MRKRTSQVQKCTVRLGLGFLVVLAVIVLLSSTGCRELEEPPIDAAVDIEDVYYPVTPCTQSTLQAASTWGVSRRFIAHCRYGAGGRTFSAVTELEAPVSLVDTPAYQECTRPGQVLFTAELCDLENQEQLELIQGGWR